MRGEKIKATDFHDAGAHGQCSYCGRYSDNPEILRRMHGYACKCGRKHGFCGSFKKPTEKSRWM